MKRKRKIVIFVLLLLIIAAFVPTPYYIYEPGSVEELSAKVNVEDGNKNAKGHFYLTTIFSIEASNIYHLAYALLTPYTEIKKTSEVQADLSDEEYSNLLSFMMRDSKQNAIVASFNQANVKTNINYQGIFVKGIREDSKAKGVLQVGDIITMVDGKNIIEVQEFTRYLDENKKVGDLVNLAVQRNGKTVTKEVEVIGLQNEKVGLGIIPEEDFTVTTNDKKVELDSEDIGGPSAGLMFSLEIFNQLTSIDYTKGYKVAGTGTIDHMGNVGQIGGIKHKVTSASREGIDIFFVPKDINEVDANEKDALEEVKENNYTLKVIPVASLKEAVDYLKTIPENKK
ncbi:SepM family pheromone-processing serine protease [Bacillus sp. 31A1R]|uniref:endopeptidase La n=1 Tax=Robertmurraya mangrovi TaxID=3098077 RepID=A0ABU5IY51_9BACI|nr:SepM family pheromone-processing serine protease [Bacillus sp. 31A1R]MDZ5472099.1 SepM family pheromone-processing serine protease [Bacillus sp. 31A1R]